MKHAALLTVILGVLGRTPEKDAGPKPFWKRLGVTGASQGRTLAVRESGMEVFWDKTTRFLAHRTVPLKELKRNAVVQVFGKLHSLRQPGVSTGEPLITDVAFIGTGNASEQPPLTPATKFVVWQTGTLQSNRPPYFLKVGGTEYRLAVEDDAVAYSTEKITAQALAGKQAMIRGISDKAAVDSSGKQRPVTLVLVREAHLLELNAKHMKVFQSQWGEERKTGSGLRGEYFARKELKDLKVTRIDATVDFDWGTSAPGPELPEDNFSVRWSGQVKAPTTDTFTFYTFTDDGARLWVDGKLLVDKWVGQGPTEWKGTVDLTAGKLYDIRMEFFDGNKNAVARLLWSSPSLERQVIPQGQLYSPPLGPEPPAAPAGLTATVTADRGVELVWKQSTSPGITQNKVYRSAKSGGPFEPIVTIGAATRFEVKGPVESGFYAVAAVGLAGESARSEATFVKVK